MSDQKIQSENGRSEAVSGFLPDPNEVPRTIFWSVCFLAYATLIGGVVGNANYGFVVGLGSACGLGAHQIAMRRDWALRAKMPRRPLDPT
ncbi:MAG: hypothetical protein JWQ22_2870 [Devosia sp.]|nr:hypothetical protein [Devosia sp.]